MQFTTVKQIVLDADARARTLDKNGRLEALAPVYETALAALRLALGDDDPQPPWERVVVTLTDTRSRLIVDALDQTPLEQMRRRVACIADVREVSGFSSPEDIHTLISATINLGAPRYNGGDVRGCAALYWTTITLITETPAVRGFPGYAKAVAQLKPISDLDVPAGPFTAAAADAFAWELRHALDAVARITS
jgi:hypothetical protein